MIIKIEKGDRFKCIKDFKMQDGRVAYTKGMKYLSEANKAITDDELDTGHIMNNEDIKFFKYFKLIYKKKE